jgi:hypothetical protein
MALEGGEGSASRPDCSLPPGKTWYPLYRRLGGPQGQSGEEWKISLPQGFDPRTVQPVASHYTDHATWPLQVTVLPSLLVNRIQEKIKMYTANKSKFIYFGSHSNRSNLYPLKSEDMTKFRECLLLVSSEYLVYLYAN